MRRYRVTSPINSSIVRQQWFRVTFACTSSHTRSIRLSFGQYGGRKCNTTFPSNCFTAARLAWLSWQYHDISQGNDATPLWIPQIGMALGCVVLLVAMVDDSVRLIRRKSVVVARDELKLIE